MLRPALALGLLVVFALVAFGARVWQHWRATGRSGIAGIAERPGSPGWIGGVLFAVACVLAPLAPVAELTGLVAPLYVPEAPLIAVGLAVGIAGIAATHAAQRAMGRSWRIGVAPEERTALVTGGPFRWVRNPIYSCMFLAGAGLFLLVPDVVTIAAALALVIGIELQVRFVEEPYLRRMHGAAYERYAVRVGRFVPGIGRLDVIPRP